MPIIAIASALAQFAPMIAGWLGGPKAEDVAQKVVGVAQAVTGAADGNAALGMIQTDPNLAFQFQKAVLDQQFELAKLAHDEVMAEIAATAENAKDVNATMQAEAKADHWPTYSWRPFIGFVFGIMIFGDYFVIPLLQGWWPAIRQPTIPPEAWVAIGGILGVASFFRGKAQADPRIPTDNRG